MLSLHDGWKQFLNGGVEVFSTLHISFKLAGDEVERFGNDSVQHGVGTGDISAGTDRAKFKLVAGKGERTGAVSIASFFWKRGKNRYTRDERSALLAGLGGAFFKPDRKCPEVDRPGRWR